MEDHMRNMEKMVESVAPRGRFWDPEFFVSTRAARDVQVCANPSGFVVLPGTVNPVYYSSVMSCCSLADPGGAPPPPSIQILWFLHTNFPQSRHDGPWRPFREILDPPLLLLFIWHLFGSKEIQRTVFVWHNNTLWDMIVFMFRMETWSLHQTNLSFWTRISREIWERNASHLRSNGHWGFF